MTTFYCVRHGKTLFNENGVFQGGKVDSPLLQAGISGALSLGEQLETVFFDQVVVSPQKRAQDTCDLILSKRQQKQEACIIDDLREMEFGCWEGELESDYHHLEEFQHLVHHPHLYQGSICGGETFQQVITRSSCCFEELARQYPEGNILLVSHGLLLQTFIRTVQGIPLSDIRKGEPLKNTSVSILETMDGGENFIVKKWNCTKLQ